MTTPTGIDDSDDGAFDLSLRAFDLPSATVAVVFGAKSHRGLARRVNEDHYIVISIGRHQQTLLTSLPDEVAQTRFDEYGYAMVVADGMGGSGAGESASHLAIATLVSLVRYFGKWNLRVDDTIAQDIMARAERFYRYVHSTVANERHKDSTGTSQTTLTAVFSAGTDLFFAHIGHSRAYLLRHGQLVRLTRDHTTGLGPSGTEPIGPLIDVNAAALDLRHILTNTVGMAGSPMIDLERMQLDDNDRVLVCTNGISDNVDARDIAAVLASEQSPDDQCEALVDLSVTAKSEDDATAIIAHYRVTV